MMNFLAHILRHQVKLKPVYCIVLPYFFLFFFAWTSTTSATDAPKAADLVVNNQLIDLSSAKYQVLFNELIADHGFKKSYLLQLFKDVSIDKKVLQLMDKPWEAKPYHQYRPRLITPSVISNGKKLLVKHQDLLDQVEDEIGVNREHILAIWAVESRYGAHQGKFQVFKTLNTLFAAYPRRSDYFREELINFIVLCRNSGFDPLQIKGSYAGAFGQAQFMPSSYLRSAVDFDKDNRVDLIHSHADIFASIANYLKKAGWVIDSPVYAEIGDVLNSQLLKETLQTGRKGRIEWRLVAETQQLSLPRPPNGGRLSIVGLHRSKNEGGEMRYYAGYPNFQAITEYNHSNKYAMVISELAREYTK